MSDLKYWLGFNLVKGIGPAKLEALRDYFAGDLGEAWQATESQLRTIGFDQRAIQAFFETRNRVDLNQELARTQAAGVHLVTWETADYPRSLHDIPASPPVLFIQGRLTEADVWAVAVVGTRRVTTYGRQVTRDLTRGLVQSGVTIVSGLARGIDAIAHKTALEMGGRTIAVLGSGLDCVYPAEHRPLVQQIVEKGQGAVISEYALGVQPEAKNFPPRNRIISGLSLGVVVIEAGEQSGALITTSFALAQNREVFAVPGNINSPSSAGTNRLIQQGAKLVTTVDDILEELNVKMVPEKVAIQMVLPDSAEEAALISHLSRQPIHIDDLSRMAGLPAPMVSSTLTLMELKGVVQQVGGMNYVLAREPGPVYEMTEGF